MMVLFDGVIQLGRLRVYSHKDNVTLGYAAADGASAKNHVDRWDG